MSEFLFTGRLSRIDAELMGCELELVNVGQQAVIDSGPETSLVASLALSLSLSMIHDECLSVSVRVRLQCVYQRLKIIIHRQC